MSAFPWYDEWRDEYAFEVADFPTPESIREWAAKEWGPTEALEVHGPGEEVIHDHDEDEGCDPSPKDCTMTRRVVCWVGEPSDEWSFTERHA